ncbi:MAG: cell division protein ZapA [Tidjanibacter sp.]|nr:cell division protein ZapA [Tidjanibacter sp.]MBR3682342.1 cell division protein ZapA [Tidjanibacter sp.]MBR7129346.1 cell division protein ZapA [Tidjanibacter sp.]
MAEFLNINLDIAGKKYPLRIERAKEELYRKAEKEINRWVATIESRYRMDKEGCLAMAALQVALQNVEHATSRNIDDDLAELTAIERTLDDYLSRLE